MPQYIHQLIQQQALINGQKSALEYKNNSLSYQALFGDICSISSSLRQLQLKQGDRIAIYLPKQFESVISIFAISMAGAVFVPINPLLKPTQVKHILQDCNAKTIITSCSRAQQLISALNDCHELNNIITIDTNSEAVEKLTHKQLISWETLLENGTDKTPSQVVNGSLAAILYTSGSTGQPKGVMLSHDNLLIGAKSVTEYLNNSVNDRILALLPLSFDYGLSQITTVFLVGATAILMDYLLPQDVVKTIVKKQITGLAAVPTIWHQISSLKWPNEAQQCLRYLTNSGGNLPLSVINALRKNLPNSEIFLMYGLTEAFRSTYLAPEYIDSHPESIGRAIPNTEIAILREDGTPCEPEEPGELVHKGRLVSMGYWNNPQATHNCFRPLPSAKQTQKDQPEIAVWSGDTVKRDNDGFIYFIERKDEMIKTSGYRVSPTEIEAVIHNSGLVPQSVALGVPHPILGNGIIVITTSDTAQSPHSIEPPLIQHCKQQLANYMVPLKVIVIDSLPTTPNGKIDRKRLAQTYQDIFQD